MTKYELTDDILYKYQHKNQILCIAHSFSILGTIHAAVSNRFKIKCYGLTFNAEEGSYLVYLDQKVNKPTLAVLRAYAQAIIDVN